MEAKGGRAMPTVHALTARAPRKCMVGELPVPQELPS